MQMRECVCLFVCVFVCVLFGGVLQRGPVNWLFIKADAACLTCVFVWTEELYIFGVVIVWTQLVYTNP